MTDHLTPQQVAKRQVFELHSYIITLGKYLRALLEQRIQQTDPDMSTLQHGILRTLRHDGSFTLTELARRFHSDPSTLVPSIDALERKALVIRERDPNDRRRLPIVITAEGEALLDAISPLPDDDPFLQSAEQLAPDDMETLINLLHKLVLQLPDGDTYMDHAMKRLHVYTAALAHEEAALDFVEHTEDQRS
jgi:DNA-binding MarR family transcriptional regulator